MIFSFLFFSLITTSSLLQATPSFVNHPLDHQSLYRVLSLGSLGAPLPKLPQTTESPILLQFWASWCHSCSTVMWDLDNLTQAHKELHYYAVSIDKDKKQAFNYIQPHALFQKHPDRFFYDYDQQLSSRFQVKSVPTLLVFGRKGLLKYRHTGHLNAMDLQRLRIALEDQIKRPK